MNYNTNLLDNYKHLDKEKDNLTELDYVKAALALSNEGFIRLKNENEVNLKDKESLVAELEIFQSFIIKKGLDIEFKEFYNNNNQTSLRKQAESSQSLINMISYLLQKGESLEPQLITTSLSAKAFLDGYNNKN